MCVSPNSHRNLILEVTVLGAGSLAGDQDTKVEPSGMGLVPLYKTPESSQSLLPREDSVRRHPDTTSVHALSVDFATPEL